MALAIHWGLDVLSGLVFGLFCALVAESLAPRGLALAEGAPVLGRLSGESSG